MMDKRTHRNARRIMRLFSIADRSFDANRITRDVTIIASNFAAMTLRTAECRQLRNSIKSLRSHFCKYREFKTQLNSTQRATMDAGD